MDFVLGVSLHNFYETTVELMSLNVFVRTGTRTSHFHVSKVRHFLWTTATHQSAVTTGTKFEVEQILKS
jgi:hypothetical protein